MRNTKLFLGRSLPWLIGVKLATLKGYLVTAKIANKGTKESKSTQCKKKRCNICQYIEAICEFDDADGKADSCKGVKNCNTDFTVYKFHCNSCSKQYVGINITSFRYRFNNYQSAFLKYLSRVNPQKLIKNTFISTKLPKHNGMDDWRVTLIDTANNREN